MTKDELKKRFKVIHDALRKASDAVCEIQFKLDPIERDADEPYTLTLNQLGFLQSLDSLGVFVNAAEEKAEARVLTFSFAGADKYYEEVLKLGRDDS